MTLHALRHGRGRGGAHGVRGRWAHEPHTASLISLFLNSPQDEVGNQKGYRAKNTEMGHRSLQKARVAQSCLCYSSPSSREDKKGREVIWPPHLPPHPSLVHVLPQGDLMDKGKDSTFYLSTPFKLQRIAAPKIQYHCNDDIILVSLIDINSQIILTINFSRLNNANISIHSMYGHLRTHLIVFWLVTFFNPHMFIFFSKFNSRISSFQVQIHEALFNHSYFSQYLSR